MLNKRSQLEMTSTQLEGQAWGGAISVLQPSAQCVQGSLLQALHQQGFRVLFSSPWFPVSCLLAAWTGSGLFVQPGVKGWGRGRSSDRGQEGVRVSGSKQEPRFPEESWPPVYPLSPQAANMYPLLGFVILISAQTNAGPWAAERNAEARRV